MGQENTSKRAIVFETYAQRQVDLRRLEERLPSGLVESIANEVIYRLTLKERELGDLPQEPSSADLEALCLALVGDDDITATEIIAELRAAGVPSDVIYLKYLSASARHLGDWWVEDRLSFAEVTIGAGRILAIMRSMRNLFRPQHLRADKTAIFASVPGDTHVIGIQMAADLMREDGWRIDLSTGLDHDTLVATIAASNCSVVGLSVAGEHSIDALSRLVIALHVACPQIPIIVSGAEVEALRPIIELIGVDAIASNIDEAKIQMTSFLTSDD